MDINIMSIFSHNEDYICAAPIIRSPYTGPFFQDALPNVAIPDRDLYTAPFSPIDADLYSKLFPPMNVLEQDLIDEEHYGTPPPATVHNFRRRLPKKRIGTSIESKNKSAKREQHYRKELSRYEVFSLLKSLQDHVGSARPSVKKAYDNGLRRAPKHRIPSMSRHQQDYALGAPKTPRQNKRKALRVLLDGHAHLACPDSGSEKNIMSLKLANDLKLRIQNGPKDIKQFELGNGKHISSIGRARVPVKLPGSSLRRKKRWFYVLPNCPVPLILGMSFLQETEILTKKQHLLETCPQELSHISSLLWIGSPRQRMNCSLDGHKLVAVADTGSDLNLISLKCAKREGFFIDRRREARRRIKVGDGTEAETIGQVYVQDLGLDWREAEIEGPDNPARTNEATAPDVEALYDDPSSLGAIFHVLPGLPCDVIFGWDLVEEMDAFNRCPDLFASSLMAERTSLDLKIFINLGPVLTIGNSLLKRRRSPGLAPTAEQIHDRLHHAEMHRRSKGRMALLAVPLAGRAAAEAVERAAAERYDLLHAVCVYCHPRHAS